MYSIVAETQILLNFYARNFLLFFVRFLFLSSKVEYISMDIKHSRCNHPKCGAKIQRLYKRINRKFIPCAWMCPDCGPMQKDESGEKKGFGLTPFSRNRLIRAPPEVFRSVAGTVLVECRDRVPPHHTGPRLHRHAGYRLDRCAKIEDQLPEVLAGE
jgi:hypothetical protein